MQVGDIVHYVSHGTPPRAIDGEQAYPSVCRAAIITAHDEYQPSGSDQFTGHVDLCVINPTGLFFNTGAHQDNDHGPGTWHHKCGN
jgi:hypothetical protein